MNYKIVILEQDKVYLEKLVDFLQTHHEGVFDICTQVCVGTTDSYVALFISEDYNVDELTGFTPENLVYFTADNEKEGSMCISKYQKPEQIYEKMLKICQATESEKQLSGDITDIVTEKIQSEEKKECCLQSGYSKFNNFVLTTEYAGERMYRIYEMCEDESVDKVAVGMITHNEIPGLVKISEHEGCIKYDITNKVKLAEFIKMNNNRKSKLLMVIKSITDTIFMLEEYMLDADKLVLRPQDIYVNGTTHKCELIYYPLQMEQETENAETVIKNIIGICSELLAEISDISDDKAEQYDLKEIITTENDTEEPLREDENGMAEESGITENITEKEEMVYEGVTDSIKLYEETQYCTETDEYGGTDIFPQLQKDAEDSLSIKNDTVVLGETDSVPCLIRRKNSEKIIINRNIFKIGKDESYVDYCIKDNPTVSRNHADIIKKQDGYYLIDKGSLNHTFINGRRIEANVAEKLANEDLVQVADEVFEFVL